MSQAQTYQILDADGKVANTIVATLQFVQAAYPGRWRVVVQPAQPDEPQPANNRLSPLAFLRRFTDEERATFDLSSIDDPSAAEEQRLRAAKLRMLT